MENSKETVTTLTGKIQNESTAYQKLAMIQANLKAPKGQYNSYGKFHYRSAEDILQAVKPFLQQHECLILIDDKIEEIGNRLFIKAEIKFFSTDMPETTIISPGLPHEKFTKICYN